MTTMATTVSVTVPSPMSTSSPSSSSSASSPSSSSNWPSQSSSSNNAGSQGVNYFFGFLIAFVALLLFFVGCGFGARRSLLRSRRWHQSLAGQGSALPGGDDIEVFLYPNESPLPILWERPFQKGTGQWESMVPLSASVLPDGKEATRPHPSPLNTPLLPPPNWLSPQPRRHRRRSLESIIFEPFTFMYTILHPSLRRQMLAITATETTNDSGPMTRIASHPSTPTSPPIQSPPPQTQPVLTSIPQESIPASTGSTALPVEKKTSSDDSIGLFSGKVADVQIAVMIAMPRQVRHEEDVPDFQLGITKVPVVKPELEA